MTFTYDKHEIIVINRIPIGHNVISDYNKFIPCPKIGTRKIINPNTICVRYSTTIYLILHLYSSFCDNIHPIIFNYLSNNKKNF